MKTFKLCLATFAVASLSILLFPSCQKEEALLPSVQKSESAAPEMADPVDFSDPAQLQSVIGKNYDPLRSNLFGMPEALLKSIPSDELFGIETHPESTSREDMSAYQSTGYSETGSESPEVVTRSVNPVGAGTYTWLNRNPTHKLVYNFDLYLKVSQHPASSAYHLFWALQVNFGDANGTEHNSQGAHIGLQWWNGKKANWGGYWSGQVPPGGATTISYPWVKNRYYRLRVWRLGTNENTYLWGGWVMDMSTNKEQFIGTFPTWTINKWITSHVVWTEAPDVTCTTNVDAEFSLFYYRRADGPDATVAHGVCAYSGGAGCSNPHNTNVTGGLGWLWPWSRHKFNTTRTNPPWTQLW